MCCALCAQEDAAQLTIYPCYALNMLPSSRLLPKWLSGSRLRCRSGYAKPPEMLSAGELALASCKTLACSLNSSQPPA